MKKENDNILLSQKIGGRIKEIRLIKGLTQEQTAEKASLGVTAFSRIERGVNSNIQINTLQRIINALEVDYQTFFTFADDTNISNQVIAKLSMLEDDREFLEILDKLLDRIKK